MERLCPCGGTLKSIGRRELRTRAPGDVLGVKWMDVSNLEVEMYACDRCRELKLFLPEERPPRPEKTPVEKYLQTFVGYSRRKLEKIMDSEEFPPAARQAARELWESRREK